MVVFQKQLQPVITSNSFVSVELITNAVSLSKTLSQLARDFAVGAKLTSSRQCTYFIGDFLLLSSKAT
jgi:hypothetical protein